LLHLVAKNLGSWSKSNFAESRGEERRGEERNFSTR
jgi:hypothetical protein